MAATPVTPVPLVSSAIVTGGVSQIAVNASPNGGVITNPLLATDQGIPTSEVLYISPVGPITSLEANGDVFAIQPGQDWDIIPGQTTPTYVAAVTAGHKFSGYAL